jgi:hypothetical protein
MGQISQETRRVHLDEHPDDEVLLRPFLNGFDVTWARQRIAYNTKLAVFFLRPEAFMKDTFGFEYEIALFISRYSTIEPRTIQAIDQILNDEPARGRADQTIVVLCTADPHGK